MLELTDWILILGLLIAVTAIAFVIGKHLGSQSGEERIIEERQDAIKRSRAVLGGQFSEQLAPYLPDFPYSPTEARFIGKPIDFVVFNGMDAKDISEIVFLEVKSGGAQLNPQERALKKAVQGKKVLWKEYRVPEKLTGERI